jgi:hypothetical protein
MGKISAGIWRLISSSCFEAGAQRARFAQILRDLGRRAITIPRILGHNPIIMLAARRCSHRSVASTRKRRLVIAAHSCWLFTYRGGLDEVNGWRQGPGHANYATCLAMKNSVARNVNVELTDGPNGAFSFPLRLVASKR